MRIYENGTYRDATAEEIAEMQRQTRLAAIAERSRPFSAEEVTAMLIPTLVNTLAVDDNTALRMRQFYPTWAGNTAYNVGEKVQYGDDLWRCVQAHTSALGWEPSTATASLWERVCETHEGTIDDPIPYSGNMALLMGLYYVQNNAIYQCIRDTVNPVYNALSDLVGLYVEEV